MADLRIAMLGTKAGETIDIKIEEDKQTERIRKLFSKLN